MSGARASQLNANNPMALFGVTRYADRTEEERSRLRMTNTEATSWAAMKRKLASIDGRRLCGAYSEQARERMRVRASCMERTRRS